MALIVVDSTDTITETFTHNGGSLWIQVGGTLSTANVIFLAGQDNLDLVPVDNGIFEEVGYKIADLTQGSQYAFQILGSDGGTSVSISVSTRDSSDE